MLSPKLDTTEGPGCTAEIPEEGILSSEISGIGTVWVIFRGQCSLFVFFKL